MNVRRFAWVGLLSVALLCGGMARADSFVSLEGYPYDIDRSLGLGYGDPAGMTQQDVVPTRIPFLVYPVMGFASVVEPGDTVGIIVRYGDFGAQGNPAEWTVALVTQYVDPQESGLPIGDALPQTYPMAVEEITYDADLGLYFLVARVDEQTPMDTYSLYVQTELIRDAQSAAVSVQRNIDGTFRVVQVTDAALGEAERKTFDLNGGIYPRRDADHPQAGALRQAVAEINLLRPAFAVFTGDLTAGDDYGARFPAVHDVLRDTRVPMFLLPGHTDGIVTRADDEGDVIADGLNAYRRTMGPAYYSFDYGDLHVIALNSYDGSADRRLAHVSRLLGTNAENYGGQLGQAQLRWLDADARAATLAGKYIWVFVHHDPRGPYSENRPLSRTGYRPFRKDVWNFDGDGWDSDPTDDLFNETEANNTGTEALRIFADNNVVAVFLGHAREDRRDVFDDGDEIRDAKGGKTGVFAKRPLMFVSTTPVAAKPAEKSGYWGYRVIEVEENVIARTDYADDYLIDSVPLGNAWIETHYGNDGILPSAAVTLVNGLPRSLTATARLFLPRNGVGYDLTNFETGEAVAWKDVGITGTGGLALYATLHGDGIGTYSGFPMPPYEETRTSFSAVTSQANTPPTAAIDVYTDAADRRHVQLRGDGSTDPDGVETIWRYAWDFGDGTTATGRVVEHTYAEEGKYYAVLRLTDDHGGQGETYAVVRALEDEDDDDEGCGMGGGASLLGLLGLAPLLLRRMSRRRDCW
jgi:hypothetical protein